MNELLAFLLELLEAAGKRESYEAREPIELFLRQGEMLPLSINVYQGGDRSIFIGTVVHVDSHGEVCETHVAMHGTGQIVQVRQLYGDWITPGDGHGGIIPDIQERAEAFATAWAQTLHAEG